MTKCKCGSTDLKGRHADTHVNAACIFLVGDPCPYASHTHWKCRRCGRKWAQVHHYHE